MWGVRGDEREEGENIIEEKWSIKRRKEKSKTFISNIVLCKLFCFCIVWLKLKKYSEIKWRGDSESCEIIILVTSKKCKEKV